MASQFSTTGVNDPTGFMKASVKKPAGFFNAQRKAPYIFMLPFVLLFLVFGVYPIGYSIYISFFRWTVNGQEGFVGIQNYTRLFTTDPFFLKSLGTTVWLLIFGSFLQHLFAIPLAIKLNSPKTRGRFLFRSAYFVPYITSSVSIAIIFSRLFDERFGWLNYLLTDVLNLGAIDWLGSPAWIPVSLAIVLNWRFIGWNTVIYFAGLQSIPKDLYEAAEIDGASPLQQHLRITIPLLLPVIFFTTTMSIIGGMQVFEEPFLLMGGYQSLGGPANAGLTSAFYLMYQGFGASRFGRGSAIAWVLFGFIAILTVISRVVMKRLEDR